MSNEKSPISVSNEARKNCANVSMSEATKSLMNCLATLHDVRNSVLSITDTVSEDLQVTLENDPVDFACKIREAERNLTMIIGEVMNYKADSTDFAQV